MSVRINSAAELNALIAKGMVPKAVVEGCKKALAETKTARKKKGAKRHANLPPRSLAAYHQFQQSSS